MPEWLQWLIWLAGGTIALQGAIIAAWACFNDRARGRRRCPSCWYDMVGTPASHDASFTCPECGKRVRSERRLLKTRRRYRRVLIGLCLLLIGAGAIFEQHIRRIRWWHQLPTFAVIALIPYAEELPREYEWEVDSRLFTADPSEGWLRIREVTRPLTRRQSRLLASISLRIVRDRPLHPLRPLLVKCLALPGADRQAAQSLLLELMQDPVEDIRESAARTLMDLKPDAAAALEPLMQALVAYPARSSTSSSEEPWRTHTIRLIGSFGPDAAPAVEMLISELSAVNLGSPGMSFGYDVARREAAIEALGRIGPAAAAMLPRLHATDSELESGRADYYGERAAELLISGTCHDEDEARRMLFAHPIWRVRRAAIRGPWFELDLKPEWVPYLLQALNDPTTYVRQDAAEKLLRHGVERPAAYKSLLRKDEPDQSDAWTRVQIMWRYDLDPTPVLPQLEAELSASGNGVVESNIRRMIDIIKSGVKPKNGNF